MRRTQDFENGLCSLVSPLEGPLADTKLEGHHSLLYRDDQKEERETRKGGGTELVDGCGQLQVY